jgi:hypothetical protein
MTSCLRTAGLRLRGLAVAGIWVVLIVAHASAQV